MIIDAHVHTSRKIDPVTVEDLIRSMDEAGIDKSIIIASMMDGSPTNLVLGDVAKFPDRLYAVAAAQPLAVHRRSQLRQLNEYLERKLVVGVKFYCGYQHFYPGDPEVKPFLALCRDYEVPAVFHTGDCYCKHGATKLKFAHPLGLDEVAADWPDLTIVMAHMGYPWTDTGAEVVYNKPNVYADCSGIVTKDFSEWSRQKYIHTVREFMSYVENPEKLMFGTDFPIAAQASYVSATVEALGPYSSEVLGKVMGGNAMRVYKLEK